MSLARRAAKSILATADIVRAPPEGPRVLIYHQVGADLGREMEVDEAHFIKQVDWLQANRNLVPFDLAVERWDSDKASSLATLTFDDGYRDLYEVAFPILAERQIPFLLYLTTGPMSGDRWLHPDASPLTWEQVGRMLESGLVTVGAHTHTHPDFRRLNVLEIADELETSDNLIQAELGVHPDHFAYTYGYWSERADAMVRERYRTATLGGFVHIQRVVDPHLVPRYPVQKSDGMTLFKARMRSGFRLEEALRRRVKGYEGP